MRSGVPDVLIGMEDDGCAALWESALLALFHTMHSLRCGSALRIAQGRTVNANGVALMTKATEERLNEGFVPQKGLPFGRVEI